MFLIIRWIISILVLFYLNTVHLHSGVTMAFWSLAIPLITSALGFLGGHQDKKAANQAAAGSRLSDLMPLIQQLIQQQQTNSQTNYQAQQRRSLLTDPGAASLYPGAQVPQGAVPLQSAIAQMAYNLLPGSAKTGLSLPSLPQPPQQVQPLPTPVKMPKVANYPQE